MKLHDLRPDEGATRRRKRVGRGAGSGRGKTAGRGTKGQNARSGGGVRRGFEGGQLTLLRRLPKMRGFVNRFKVTYAPVNLDNMSERFEADAQVSPASLFDTGLLGSSKQPVVVLSRGEIDKPLHLQVHRISKSAREKIEAAGGSVEILPFAVNKNLPRS
jgi:large subunit ribosomal protein L15